MSNADSRSPKSTRTYTMALDIEATLKDVWEALTNAEELVRWFPIDAQVTPGAGGSMHWSWGEGWSSINRIDAWDPPRLLRLVDDAARPYDADGKPLAGGKVEPARVVVEMTLETVNGRTRVTLVHSGFGHGAARDDEIEGISGGWPFELRSLRRYLTQFRGRTRYAAHAQRSTPVTVDDAWAQLVSPNVVAIDAASFATGEPYQATLATGDEFTGVIEMCIPNRAFSGTVKELGDGIFRLHAYPADGQSGLTAWAATYDPVWAEPMRGLERRLQKMLDGLLEVR